MVYVEEGKSVNLKTLFRSSGARPITPWIVALVQGGPGGFRFSIMSKVPLKPSRDIVQSIPSIATTKQVPGSDGKPNQLFQWVFWNNSK